ncbi:MAG: hydrogenase nickel incorporation protein HypB [Phycisphaerae bacterium]
MSHKVPIVENVLKLNDELALQNRDIFQQAGVFVVDLIGSPGAGKTSLLELTLRELGKVLNIGVIVGDPATCRDGDRLAAHSSNIVQINTGTGCHLDANQVRHAMDKLNLPKLDLLIIENVGNLICPVSFNLGQDCKVGMFSVSEGDDKAAKHPNLVVSADLLLLNKMDLLPYIPFDLSRFRQDIQHLNRNAQLLELSVLGNQVKPWLDWLISHSQHDKQHSHISQKR